MARRAGASFGAGSRSGAAAPRAVLAGFLVLFVYALASFYQRGTAFVQLGDRPMGSTGSSSFGPSNYRDMRFHWLVLLAVVVEAFAYGLELFEVEGYPALPWLSGGRILSSVLLLVVVAAVGAAAREADGALGEGGGSGTWASAGTVAALALGAWAQLAVAASAPQLALHWGLFFSGLVSGTIAFGAVAAVIEDDSVDDLNDQVKPSEKAEVPFSLLRFCCLIYALLWLPSGGFQWLGPISRAVLTGLLDALTVVGVGHLLLKRVQLLDKALLPKARGPDFSDRP